MNEETCLEYNEKAMMQEEVHQLQKHKDTRRKEIVMVLPSEHPPASEVEEINSERNEENS
jgi:hypothetical protein